MFANRPLIWSSGLADRKRVFCRSESRNVLVSYRDVPNTLTSAFQDFRSFARFFCESFAIASGQVVSCNMATAKSVAVREPNFFMALSPFRNLSPRCDLRTDLVSKIRSPQGRRMARRSRIVLRVDMAQCTSCIWSQYVDKANHEPIL